MVLARPVSMGRRLRPGQARLAPQHVAPFKGRIRAANAYVVDLHVFPHRSPYPASSILHGRSRDAAFEPDLELAVLVAPPTVLAFDAPVGCERDLDRWCRGL